MRLHHPCRTLARRVNAERRREHGLPTCGQHLSWSSLRLGFLLVPSHAKRDPRSSILGATVAHVVEDVCEGLYWAAPHSASPHYASDLHISCHGPRDHAPAMSFGIRGPLSHKPSYLLFILILSMLSRLADPLFHLIICAQPYLSH